MKTERFDCPYCKQPIETDAETAQRGLNCPSCFKFFQPDIPKVEIKKTVNVPKPQLSSEAAKLKDWADTICLLSLWALGIGCFCLFLTLLYHINPDNGVDAMDAVYILFGTAIYLWLMAQLIHIRANTEK
jgi:hypothetical protein